MNKFQREDRYIVLKRKDVEAAGLDPSEQHQLNSLCNKVSSSRTNCHKPPLECVVAEKGRPEYDAAWAAIEARMSTPVHSTDAIALLRADFEAWAKPRGYRCHWSEPDGIFMEGYRDSSTAHAYTGWKAACEGASQ